jgi:AbiJ N-terminal domain 4
MADPLPPFSSRNRRDTAQIDGEVPATARVGLMHLLAEAVREDYIGGWHVVTMELQRIARLSPLIEWTRSEDTQAKVEAEGILDNLPWDKVYDFCERLHSRLATEIGYNDDNNEYVVRVSKTEAQQFLADELERLFREENLAFEFRDGIVQRRGKRHTVTQISKAETVLADARLVPARKHFAKAVRYFRDRVKPDPENAVKEAVCAVEAARRKICFRTLKRLRSMTLSNGLRAQRQASSQRPSVKLLRDCMDSVTAVTELGTAVPQAVPSHRALRSMLWPRQLPKSSFWWTSPIPRKRFRFNRLTARTLPAVHERVSLLSRG